MIEIAATAPHRSISAVNRIGPQDLTIDALILGVLFLVLGRMLDPLANLARGMIKLEDGHYATRLEQPKVQELAAIAERFTLSVSQHR